MITIKAPSKGTASRTICETLRGQGSYLHGHDELIQGIVRLEPHYRGMAHPDDVVRACEVVHGHLAALLRNPGVIYGVSGHYEVGNLPEELLRRAVHEGVFPLLIDHAIELYGFAEPEYDGFTGRTKGIFHGPDLHNLRTAMHFGKAWTALPFVAKRLQIDAFSNIGIKEPAVVVAPETLVSTTMESLRRDDPYPVY